MKKILLILVAIAALAACSKDFSGGLSDGELSDEVISGWICSGGCPACDLVHHPAKEPSYAEPGNAEFWQCPHCKVIYADPDAGKRFEGMVYILPTRIIQGENNLKILAGEYDAGTKGAISKFIVEKSSEIALAAVLTGLVAGVASLAVTIEEMTTNNDEIEAALNVLSGKVDKTAEEISEMKGKVAELQKSVAQTGVLMSNLTTQVDSLYDYLDSLVEYSRSVEHISEVIFDEIETIDEDFHYRKLLDDRHHDLAAITDPCIGAVNAISTCLSTDLSYFESAQDYLDSLSVTRLCMMDLNNIISAWGSDKGNYAALTCNLIQSYFRISNNPSETFPSVLESYINNHIIWEHQGYVFRVSNMITDLVITTTSYYLARSYFHICSGWDRNYADLKCKALDEDYNTMSALYDDELEKINRSDSLFRRCLINGKLLDAQMKTNMDAVSDYSDWLGKEYGSANVVSEFDKHQDILFRSSETDCFCYEDWEWMQAASYAEEKDFNSVLLTYDDGGMGFRINWDRHLWGILFPYTDFGRLSTWTDGNKTNIGFYFYNGLETAVYDGTGYLLSDGNAISLTINAQTPFGFIFPYTENQQSK